LPTHDNTPQQQHHNSATLVVCPVVAVIQWRGEIARYTAPGALRVAVYHGAKRGAVDPAALAGADVVLTTYSTIEADYRRTMMPAKVPCAHCGKKYLPESLHTHLRFFCGPFAQKTEAQARQQRKRDRRGGDDDDDEEGSGSDDDEEEEDDGSSSDDDGGGGRRGKSVSKAGPSSRGRARSGSAGPSSKGSKGKASASKPRARSRSAAAASDDDDDDDYVASSDDDSDDDDGGASSSDDDASSSSDDDDDPKAKAKGKMAASGGKGKGGKDGGGGKRRFGGGAPRRAVSLHAMKKAMKEGATAKDAVYEAAQRMIEAAAAARGGGGKGKGKAAADEQRSLLHQVRACVCGLAFSCPVSWWNGFATTSSSHSNHLTPSAHHTNLNQTQPKPNPTNQSQRSRGAASS
jgi:hypothetical protein